MQRSAFNFFSHKSNSQIKKSHTLLQHFNYHHSVFHQSPWKPKTTPPPSGSSSPSPPNAKPSSPASLSSPQSPSYSSHGSLLFYSSGHTLVDLLGVNTVFSQNVVVLMSFLDQEVFLCLEVCVL